MPSYARQFAGGFRRPDLLGAEGLGPAIAVAQDVSSSNPRSTVGTLTEVHDLLRLLFARLGDPPAGVKPTRGLFSWNGSGACPACRGLGLEDRLDPELLVADAGKTIREGALRVSTPNGYLMYSQVTLAVLDEVLRAHGGSVDVPWRDLSDEVREVILRGSDRVLVPFGKHPLENRLKWKGITARPRQEGHYRGLLPVMEEILRGKRNDSILRFVRSTPCAACDGTRLSKEALSVTWRGATIAELSARTARDLRRAFEDAGDGEVLGPIRDEILARCGLLEDLGLGYLSFDRAAPTLSPGEARRLKLLSLALGELRGLVVVLDEPSAGLHPHDTARLLGVLRRLTARGQTVVVVDHEPLLARSADWLVDLGPGPAKEGGRLLFAGPPSDLLGPDGPDTPTRRALRGEGTVPTAPVSAAAAGDDVVLEGLSRHNVAGATLRLLPRALNVVTGIAGAGKTSLIDAAVARLREGVPFARTVAVDAEPIGRTPRSNAATYTGAFDVIRDLFAATPEAKARGFGKGHFTFNTAGGRCESCEGAGVHEVGMRWLGSVDLACGACGGRRFHADVLAVKLDGLSVADVLDLTAAEAEERFRRERKLARVLAVLVDLGLGYLPLGQSATTLSGGEAQRVKLATELARATGPALVVLDEPTTGLHPSDVAALVEAFRRLTAAGHTLLVADHDLDLLRAADRVTEVGPGSGPEGGLVVVEGTAADLAACAASPTGAALRGDLTAPLPAVVRDGREDEPLALSGVATHNLRGVAARFPCPGLTVVTGPSGSGKSSLVFDTLLAESQARFADLLSPWARRFLPMKGGAELESASGLHAAVAVPAEAARRNPRSTVGTTTGIDELLRLLFARGGSRPCPACGRDASGSACACGTRLEPLLASDFSPHSERGACPACRGLGFVEVCDPARLASRPDLPLDGGAIGGTRFGAYLGETDGQHVATLRAAAAALGLDVSGPWSALSPEARTLAMDGAGERAFEVDWSWKRGKRRGVHRLAAKWAGFARLVEAEYERVHADERGEELEPLLVDRPCPACGGERLAPRARAVTLAGRRAPEATAAEADALAAWLDGIAAGRAGVAPDPLAATASVREALVPRLRALRDAGLGYLSPVREMASLSGGEAQRVRLAAALGGGLVGVTYVLDEPTQGLHRRDTRRLVDVLRSLADAGNAVVVVEHDAALVAAADHVVELGPGAGPEGGLVVAEGPPAALRSDRSSYTGRLLARADAPAPRAPRAVVRGVTVRGAARHNLKDIDVDFPAGGLVVVAGVSGSGKSTLVLDVLAPSLRAALRGDGPVGCRALERHAEIAEVLASDQDGLAVSGGSTVATLSGLGDELRRLFAATPEAKRRRLGAAAFSTNVPGGRCEACAGRGVVRVPMDLLPDVNVGCETCGGRRFSDDVLACLLDGRSLTDLLDATVSDATSWLASSPALAPPLAALRDLGLGYLRVGQEGATLSSGERQRLRLACLLATPRRGRVALLLDEPTRGLGLDDVDRLLSALGLLADEGHLVVLVEHHPAVLAAADRVVELGPDGGAGGGRLVGAGAPSTDGLQGRAESRPPHEPRRGAARRSG
ncbi:MAG: ATP-binding cassette domain-containing protein [Thermoanaerobaculia bacterium]|jgi:excinuclease ABC subunit A|nr:ATP-binding cassette domain-containing protein [Thermoanaerobaculia bacterium]